jgi:hypothetical protein
VLGGKVRKGPEAAAEPAPEVPADVAAKAN